MKIGLLVIATNKYIQFVNPLWESVKKHFMKNHEVTMFVFTNRQDFIPQQGQVVIPQEHMSWPGPTLMRYSIFNKSSELLKDMDYLYYCDADMLFVDEVGDEILGDLVGTLHPGFYNKTRNEFTYDTNPNCLAYVAPHEGDYYFAGGFNGGKTSKFLEMCLSLAINIDKDLQNGIVAVWHDESHMNRYFINNEPEVFLSPSYCFPESWSLPFERKLLALDKNHSEMRK